VDWKPERAVQAKSGIFKTKQKKQSYDCWNTLREEYIAPVQKWRLFPRFQVKSGLSPNEITSYYSALSLPYQMAWLSPQECHIQWRLPSAVLRNRSTLQTYIFRLVPSSHLSHTVIRSLKSNSYIHASTHQYFHVFTHSCVHLHMHNINLHITASIAQSLFRQYPFASVLNHFKWRVQTNENLETYQKVSSPVSLVKRCH